MTSRERILAVLGHEIPDRVTLMELWIDRKVVDAISPGGDSNDVAVQVGLDVVTVPTMVYAPEEVTRVDRTARVFRDKWGALQTLTEEAVAVPTKPPRIETAEDLAGYVPPDPAASPVIERVRALRARFPDKAVAVVGESGWAPAVYLRGGYDNLFLDLALRPEFARDVMRIGVEYYRALYPLCFQAGADLVLLGDDYACKTGTLISPTQLVELVLPGDAAVIAAIKQAGGYCIKHSDGRLWDVLDDLVATGLDCLGPLEPNCGMDLGEVWQRYSGRVGVMGNVDVDLLSRGSVDEVIAATKHLLASVSVHGGHIMSSGNSISSSVRPENFRAMVDTTMELGVYPLDPERVSPGEQG